MRPGGSERGIALIEVVISMGLLVAIFIPVGLLLQSGVKTVGSLDNENTASNIIAGVVSQMQSDALSTTSSPPYMTTTASLHHTNPTPKVPIWREKATKTWVTPALQTIKDGTTTYAIYGVGGWCLLEKTTSNGSKWEDYSTTTTSKYSSTSKAEYFVAVKVAWSSERTTPNTTSSQSGRSVTGYAALPNQSTWTIPSKTTTTFKRQNFCPVDPTNGVS
jgi:type II secretory pathway pseudopilin PulG